MKKLILCVSLFVMFSTTSSVLAKEVVEVNTTSQEVRVNTGQWRTLTPVEELAYANPGVEQPVYALPKAERVDFWHYISIQEYSEVVVFKNNKLETMSKMGEKRSEPKLAVYVIFLLIAILLMGISNWLRKKDISISVVAFAAAATFAAAFAVVATVVIITAVAFVAAAFAVVATVVIIIAVDGDNKMYKIFSVMFYIAAIIAVIPF